MVEGGRGQSVNSSSGQFVNRSISQFANTWTGQRVNGSGLKESRERVAGSRRRLCGYNDSVSPRLTSSEWDALTGSRPEVHLLQTAAWAEFKAKFGWESHWLSRDGAAAQILIRGFPGGARLAYVPKGPTGPWLPSLLPELDQLCRDEGVFLLKVEPDEIEAPELEADLRQQGFRPGPSPVQPRRSIVVSLEGEESDWLSRMHSKTRYNIQLSGRKGVRVISWNDLGGFGALMRATADRQSFGVHHPDYYRTAFEIFHPRGECELLAAEYEGQILAALMVFARGRRAWYFYGGSTNRERSRMPTYLLQWEAMRWARAHGCVEYDLWGVPDHEEPVLESEFTARSDGLWGVYRFKRGFGGRLIRTAGAWDRPRSMPLYYLYRLVAGRSVY